MNVYVVEQYDETGTAVELFSNKRTAEEYAASLVIKHMVEYWHFVKSSLPKFYKLDDALEFANKKYKLHAEINHDLALPTICCYKGTLNNTCKLSRPVYNMMKENYMIREAGFDYGE